MKLTQLIEEFRDLEPEERLEELIELADRLPPLSPGRTVTPFPETCRVQECQTPVFLWVDVDFAADRVSLEADVPRKSPTVRGLLALVVEGLEGATVAEVLTLPDDLLGELGLTEALGMTRQQGFRGVISRNKQTVRSAASSS
jgi:cysteine desulfuration protein SufE